MHTAVREGNFTPATVENSANRERRQSRLFRIVGGIALATAVITSMTSMHESSPEPMEAAPTIAETPAVAPPQEYIPQPDIHGEQIVIPGQADPNVYKESNDSFYLSGTGEDTRTLAVYHSSSLRDFTQVETYNPSALDQNHDYCNLWAPDITKNKDGKLEIFFTAEQMAEGQSCKYTHNRPRIYHATSSGHDTHFGPPQRIDNDGCLPESCNNIDPEVVHDKDGDTWLFYTWFGRGQNVISALDMDNPSHHHTVAVPVYNTDGAVNEAPDVFEKDGKFYMLYSRNSFDADYGLSYIEADSIDNLTRAKQQSHILTSMIWDTHGRPIVNSGHSSVVERNGKYYVFYHKGTFDNDGEFLGRSTYVQQIHFENDGAIKQLDIAVPSQSPAS